jgi:MFS family permease
MPPTTNGAKNGDSLPIGHGVSGIGVIKPGRIFYGWWVIASVYLLYALTNGIYWSGFSFYFLPITKDLGLSRTSMSVVLGLGRLVGGLQGPLSGYLVDRLGPRPMIACGGLLAGLGFILLGRSNSFQSFLLVYLGLVAIGFAGGFDQGIIAVANRWFVRRKAQALSFLWVGLALGSAFVAPIVGLLVVNIGWRDTAAISGAAVLVLLVPAVLLIRNSPEDMGLTPDGDGRRTPFHPSGTPGQIATKADAASPAYPSSEGPGAAGDGTLTAEEAPLLKEQYAEVTFTAKQGFKTVSYWLLALALGLQVAGNTGLLTHFVPMIVWKGQSEAFAGLLIGIYGLATIPLFLLMGWVGDRWPKDKVSSFGMIIGAAGLGVLVASDGQGWQLVLVMLLLAASYSTTVTGWALVGELFGRKAFATLLGGITMTYSLLSATTPILAGWIFDSTGSYFWALLLMAALLLASGMMFWNIPRPKLGTSVAPTASQ